MRGGPKCAFPPTPGPGLRATVARMPSEKTLRRMTEHADHLARRYRVALSWKPGAAAESYPDLRAAVAPPVLRGSDYLVALHELGHVVSRKSRRLVDRTDPGGALRCEGAAWAWAARASDPALVRHLTKADWRRVAECFGSHIRYHADPD